MPGLRFLLIIALLILCSSVTIAQQMGSSTVYTDQWIDSSDPNAPRIVGCGITQDFNNTYSHTYWSEITITSPTGRTATVTSSTSSSYSRAETSLLWDWSNPDPGDYQILTRHFMRCPYIGGSGFPFSSTGGPFPVIYKNHAYLTIEDTNTGGDFGFGVCGYGRTCEGQCSRGAFVASKLYPGPCGPGRYI